MSRPLDGMGEQVVYSVDTEVSFLCQVPFGIGDTVVLKVDMAPALMGR